MITHFEIRLKNYRNILQIFLPYLELGLIGQSIKLFKDSDNEVKQVESLIYDDIKGLFEEDPKIKMCAFSGLEGGNKLRTHIDGHQPPKPSQHWALNIPIKNCSQSIMYWYSNNYEISYASPTGNPNLVADNLQHIVPSYSGEKKIIDKYKLDSPFFARVTLPHNVINYSSDARFLLSIRFNNELKIKE